MCRSLTCKPMAKSVGTGRTNRLGVVITLIGLVGHWVISGVSSDECHAFDMTYVMCKTNVISLADVCHVSRTMVIYVMVKIVTIVMCSGLTQVNFACMLKA